MSVKDSVLSLLLESNGKMVSGQSMADKLSCSRMAISKSVQTLIREGYDINISKHYGYSLGSSSDVLSQAVLESEFSIPVCYVPECRSTFFESRKMISDGVRAPFAIVAGIQTGGRGRLGRSFFSPQGGVYLVDEKIKYDLRNAKMEHASNLAGLIADEIAKGCNCPAYIADPVVTDEMSDLARVTGMPEISRISVFHALNSRAVSRRYAASIGRRYEDLNLIVAHLGGGISISAHSKGRVIDVNNALDGDGPFSPERAGSIPTRQLVDLCFSGKYTYDEIRRKINGHGGLFAHLGTTDVRNVVEEIKAGNTHAYNVLHAMAYNIAKTIGSMHIVLRQKTDAIILTGGMAYGDYVVSEISSWIDGLAHIEVIPGEDEMGALAMNALGALRGELPLQVYNPG